MSPPSPPLPSLPPSLPLSFSIVIPDEVSVETTSGTNLTEGETLALNCRSNGSSPAPTQVQWLRNGIPLLDSSPRITINTPPPSTDYDRLYSQTSNLTITDTHPDEDYGQYTCKVFFDIPDVPSISGSVSISVQGTHTTFSDSNIVHLNVYLKL